MLRQLRRLALVWLLALLTASCGGGGDDVANSGGIGGTGITSGSISGFGSIFVNGIEVDLSGALVTVKGQPGSEADLKLGQVVTVTGTVSADGKSGSATQVSYDADVVGPIATLPQADADGLTKTFTMLGTTVVVDIDETVFDDGVVGFDFDTITQNDAVEVSGYFDDADVLHAKFIEKTGVTIPGMVVGVRGVVGNIDDLGQTFQIRALTVHFNGATDLSDLPGGLADDLFVGVKGTLQPDGSVLATKVELEGSTADAEAASIEGIITTFNGVDDFVINSGAGPVHVNSAGATLEPAGVALANGLEVDVEGSIVGGTLMAFKVKPRAASIRLETVVYNRTRDPDPKTGKVTVEFPVRSGETQLTVIADAGTRLQDQVTSNKSFDLSQIVAGDFLKVRAYQDGQQLVATRIKRVKTAKDVVLQGPADKPPTGGDNTNGVVSILRIEFITDDQTEFQDVDDTSLTGTEFFGIVSPGALIRIKDKKPGDGIADEVELEN